MAVFQKIRDNSLLSLIVIGGGLFLFILGDSFSNKSTKVDDSVGDFEGGSISAREFDNYFSTILYLNGNRTSRSALSDQEKQQYSAQTWNQLLMEKIFESEAKENGIAVTEEEVDEMLAGDNPYPFYVFRLFGGQEYYQSIRQKLSENVEDYMSYAQVNSEQEAELIKNFGVSLRKQEKLMSLLKNSFYTTSSESLDLYESKYGKKDVTVATIPYYLVPDSLIDVSEQEIKTFYQKNKGKYKLLNPTKKVVYGAYRVDPTQEDDSQVLTWAQETVGLFKEEENDELFVKTESETAFDNSYYKKGAGLVSELDNALFEQEKGFVYGPYSGFSGGNKTYNVAKIIDVQQMPDSAKVSHILITPQKYIKALTAANPEPTREQVVAMWEDFDEYVDSIYEKITEDGFETLAVAVSEDTASAAKGGDLGWIQEKSQVYPPQFLDSVFLETSGANPYKKIKISTRNGDYYHIVRVDEMGEKSKKIKVGIVSKSVLPGTKTRNNYFNKINQVSIALNEGKTLVELKDSFQFYIDSLTVEPQQFIVNDLKGGRDLVHWAFNDDENELSRVFDFDRRYVVAQIVSAKDKGYKSLKDQEVRGEIEEKVRKIKKAAYVAEKVGEVNGAKITGISEVIAGASVRTVENVVLADGVPQLNYESALTGAISSLKSGSFSPVIAGVDGAYLVQVNKENPASVTDDTNFDLESTQLSQQNRGKLDYILQELITEKADVEDKRQTLQ